MNAVLLPLLIAGIISRLTDFTLKVFTYVHILCIFPVVFSNLFRSYVKVTEAELIFTRKEEGE